MQLKWMLAFRLARSRRKGALSRFISFASTCGIAIGVFAAIVGFSAMNGFERELNNRVLSVIPAAQIKSGNAYFENPKAIINLLEAAPEVMATAQGIETKAIISSHGTFSPILLNGIDLEQGLKVIDIERFSIGNIACLDSRYPITAHSSTTSDHNTKERTTTTPTNASSQASVEQAHSLARAADYANLDKRSLTVTDQALTALQGFAETEPVNCVLPQPSTGELTLEELNELPRIVLGVGLARRLAVGIGDTVTLMTLKDESDLIAASNSRSVSGVDHSAVGRSAMNDSNWDDQSLGHILRTPDTTRVLVVGLIALGGQTDTALAAMDFSSLRDIVRLHGPNVIHVRTREYNNVEQVMFSAVSGRIHESAYLLTWMSSQGKLHNDIQMIRQIMFVSMFLVLAVSCFNIISNLMMTVSEKRREIAILMTLGMQRRQVLGAFALVGLVSGGIGTLIGIGLGMIVSLLISPITSSFKDWFGFEILNADIYFINFIPCELQFLDVIIVFVCALLMSLGAALYPAIRAAAVRPAQELSLAS